MWIAAESKGCGARNELLKKLNNEKNTPLHAAVSSGDIKACFMFYLSIDSFDTSTCYFIAGDYSIVLVLMLAGPDAIADANASPLVLLYA